MGRQLLTATSCRKITGNRAVRSQPAGFRKMFEPGRYQVQTTRTVQIRVDFGERSRSPSPSLRGIPTGFHRDRRILCSYSDRTKRVRIPTKSVTNAVQRVRKINGLQWPDSLLTMGLKNSQQLKPLDRKDNGWAGSTNSRRFSFLK